MEPIQQPVPDLATATLDDIRAHIAAHPALPVERWHPDHCGNSDMRIAADGQWYHEGSPIGRKALVQQFSRLLRREADGSYVLVNPSEKLSIEVEDAPFIAVEMRIFGEGQRDTLIVFRLNVDQFVIVGPDHPLHIRGHEDAPRPYVHVRGTMGRGLEARIARPLYYEMIEHSLSLGGETPSLASGGERFGLAVKRGDL